MFTGIVQAQGSVVAFTPNDFGARLTLDVGEWQPADARAPRHGDSICVSGVCLTVMAIEGRTLSFDVIAETLAHTTLGELTPGARVNLEPAVTPQQPLGGHFMQGHVDGVGRVSDVQHGPEEWRITIEPPTGLMDYLVPKGSVAIDGVSLTIAAVTAHSFEVALIPTTLDLTTLRDRRAGDGVNLEADIVSKTVVHALRRQAVVGPQGAGKTQEQREATWQTLREAGFTG